MLAEYPFIKYYDDGMIEIFGNPSGSPEITAVSPAPDINTKTGEDRFKKHEEACTAIILRGYLIIEKKLIRNKAFDDPGQTTTLQVRYRPCKNQSEIEEVHMQIRNIIGAKGPFTKGPMELTT